MDSSTRKKLAAGLVVLYAVSLAIFLPTILKAQVTPQITAIINPFAGSNSPYSNYLWGRESGIIKANAEIKQVNLTYIVPINLTLPLKVVTLSVIDPSGQFGWYNSSIYNDTIENYQIILPKIGEIVNVTSLFTARATEPVFNISSTKLAPYYTNITKGVWYFFFNTTPPGTYTFNYGTNMRVTMYVPSSTYANITAYFSGFTYKAFKLPFTPPTVVTLSVYAIPNFIGFNKDDPTYGYPVIFNFSVKLAAYIQSGYYYTNATFYFQKISNAHVKVVKVGSEYQWKVIPVMGPVPTPTLLAGLIAFANAVGQRSTSTQTSTVSFGISGLGYVFLVQLGLWSNITTVYVQPVEPTPPYPPASPYNASFRAIVIPPSINIPSVIGISPTTCGLTTEGYVYAPDDMLNWSYLKLGLNYTTLPPGEPDVNQPSVNGPWDLAGNGLSIYVYVGNSLVASYPGSPIPLTPQPNTPFGYTYKLNVTVLLSPIDSITFDQSSGILYILIKPSEVANARIVLVYNDSDYAVQWLFSPVGKNVVSQTLTIATYTPMLGMPPAVDLSAGFFKGFLADQDYGYRPFPATSELVLSPGPNNANASVFIYYPNTPPIYPPSHMVQIGVLSAFIMFANGTTERIYLSNTNITKLFTGYTMPQNVPQSCYNYTFMISIAGLEQILGISPTQAVTVLNNSYVKLVYYDFITGKTVTNMTKLVALGLNITLQVGKNNAFYWAPATPFEDIAVPGTQILYVVAVNNTLPVIIKVYNPTLAGLGVPSITTSNVTITYINQTTGTPKTVVLPNVTLNYVGNNLYVGSFALNLVYANNQPVPIGAPLNGTKTVYLASGNVKLPLAQVVNLKNPFIQTSRINITVTILGTSKSTFYQFIQIPNVLVNSSPVVYNPVNGQLYLTVKSIVQNYYYAGYVVLNIYTDKPEKGGALVFVYQQYFNFTPATISGFPVAYDLHLISPILQGKTYYIIITAITVPLSYHIGTVGSQGTIYEGYFKFGS